MGIYQDIELFGLTASAEAFDDMPEIYSAHMEQVIASIFESLAEMLSGSSLEIFDAEPLLWSQVNVFHGRLKKVERERHDLEDKIRNLVNNFDGSEITDQELQDAQKEHERALLRENQLEEMRDLAREQYQNITGSLWQPRSGSLTRRDKTAAMIDSRDYLASKKALEAAKHTPKGTPVIIAGAVDFTDVNRVWHALDKARNQHGDMVLHTQGNAKGVDLIALKWAHSRDIPVIQWRPDYALDKTAAPFKRNDRMLKDRPRGLILFDEENTECKKNNIVANLADKAAQMNIRIWRPRDPEARQSEQAQKIAA